jgi:hypothetical protein
MLLCAATFVDIASTAYGRRLFTDESGPRERIG